MRKPPSRINTTPPMEEQELSWQIRARDVLEWTHMAEAHGLSTPERNRPYGSVASGSGYCGLSLISTVISKEAELVTDQ